MAVNGVTAFAADYRDALAVTVAANEIVTCARVDCRVGAVVVNLIIARARVYRVGAASLVIRPACNGIVAAPRID